MSYQQNPLVDEYIAQFSGDTKERLEWLRSVIQATFPKTIEAISYGVPTYRAAPDKRGLVHFGATKDHLALYGIIEAKKDHVSHELITPYRTGKGTLQFKHTDKLPKHAIRTILAYHAGKFNM